MRDKEDLIKMFERLLGFTENQKNLLRDIIFESYDIGLRDGMSNKKIIEESSS